MTPNENAWQDYSICFEKLFPWVDYFVVNVSSPNTPGLRELQEKESLRKILTILQDYNRKQTKQKPLFLKISPDLTIAQLDDVIDLAIEIQLDGLVVSNTSISRDGLHCTDKELKRIGHGGFSGDPLKKKIYRTHTLHLPKNKSVNSYYRFWWNSFIRGCQGKNAGWCRIDPDLDRVYL